MDSSTIGKQQAAIAQLGERQTEDLEVPGSIPGFGILCPRTFSGWTHSDPELTRTDDTPRRHVVP